MVCMDKVAIVYMNIPDLGGVLSSHNPCLNSWISPSHSLCPEDLLYDMRPMSISYFVSCLIYIIWQAPGCFFWSLMSMTVIWSTGHPLSDAGTLYTPSRKAG